MKRVIDLISQEKFEDVKNALESIGCEIMNVMEFKGRGHQKGVKKRYYGSNYCINMLPKTRIN